MTADRILTTLEDENNSYKRFRAVNSNHINILYRLIQNELTEQRVNLSKLSSAIGEISKAIYILNPDLALELLVLVWGKSSELAVLSNILYFNEYPIDVKYNKPPFTNFIKSDSIGKVPFDDLIESLYDYWGKLPEEKNINTIDFSAAYRFNETFFEKIKQYFEIEQPRKKMARLKDCSIALRDILLQHYKIEEILWYVDKIEKLIINI